MRYPSLWLVLALLALPDPGQSAPRRDTAEPRASDVQHPPVPAVVSVCFVPAQECDTHIVAAIDAARVAVRVQAYGFTATRILRALAEAQARGVDVQVILDRSDDVGEDAGHLVRHPRRYGAAFTTAAGIPTWIDDSVAIAHNKVIVIDAHMVVGGSYNFTNAAERRNAENVTFIESPALAAQFLANWASRKAVSRQAYASEAFSQSDPDRKVSRTR